MAATYSKTTSLTLTPASGGMPVKVSITETTVARASDGATAGQAVATSATPNTKTALDLGVLSDTEMWLSLEAASTNTDSITIWRDVAGTKYQIAKVKPGSAFAELVPSAPYVASATASQVFDYVLGLP